MDFEYVLETDGNKSARKGAMGLNDILNELTRRLHGYEEITRILQTERIILENKLKTIMGTEEDKKEKTKEKSGSPGNGIDFGYD